MDYKNLIFSGHAIRQMFSREIGKNEVVDAIKTGQVIADYPDDKPYPSCLILGFSSSKPLHVVVALHELNQKAIVVTVYVPNSELWTDDYKTRR